MKVQSGAAGSRPGGRGRRIWTAAAAGTLAMAIALSAAGAAAAAGPKATTGNAHDVSYGSATVNGTVNPAGAATSYYFQYGPTRAYGGQSAIGSAGAGAKGVAVSVGLAGLEPLTVYHYRLVAVSGAGTAFGDDRTFQTTKVPLSLAIDIAPSPVVFGMPVVIQGTLSGTGNGGRQVVLLGRPFPFTAPFQQIGNPELTTATGGFSFTLLGAANTAQFQVVTTTKPAISSGIATENVAVRVSSHLARTRRRGFARVFGTVSPAEDGAQVGILRITHGHGVLVAGTVLRHHTTSSSSFSRVVKVKKGVYRVLVRVVGAGQVSNYGQPLLVR
jgi:hypothetical protein